MSFVFTINYMLNKTQITQILIILFFSSLVTKAVLSEIKDNL